MNRLAAKFYFRAANLDSNFEPLNHFEIAVLPKIIRIRVFDCVYWAFWSTSELAYKAENFMPYFKMPLSIACGTVGKTFVLFLLKWPPTPVPCGAHQSQRNKPNCEDTSECSCKRRLFTANSFRRRCYFQMTFLGLIRRNYTSLRWGRTVSFNLAGVRTKRAQGKHMHISGTLLYAIKPWER